MDKKGSVGFLLILFCALLVIGYVVLAPSDQYNEDECGVNSAPRQGLINK